MTIIAIKRPIAYLKAFFESIGIYMDKKDYSESVNLHNVAPKLDLEGTAYEGTNSFIDTIPKKPNFREILEGRVNRIK